MNSKKKRVYRQPSRRITYKEEKSNQQYTYPELHLMPGENEEIFMELFFKTVYILKILYPTHMSFKYNRNTELKESRNCMPFIKNVMRRKSRQLEFNNLGMKSYDHKNG